MNEETVTALIAALKDGNGNFIYPQTKTEAVYDENGKNVKTYLEEEMQYILQQQQNSLNKKIIVSATQPENQNTGDFWYEIIS